MPKEIGEKRSFQVTEINMITGILSVDLFKTGIHLNTDNIEGNIVGKEVDWIGCIGEKIVNK